MSGEASAEWIYASEPEPEEPECECFLEFGPGDIEYVNTRDCPVQAHREPPLFNEPKGEDDAICPF